MAHLTMDDLADPPLNRVRCLAARFRESVEVESCGRPTSRTGKGGVAVFGASERCPKALAFAPNGGVRLALAQDSRFFVQRRFDPSARLDLDLDLDLLLGLGLGLNLGLDLTAGPVDWGELSERPYSSFRHIALRRQLVALDSRTGASLPPVRDGAASVATPTPSPRPTPSPTQPTEPT